MINSLESCSRRAFPIRRSITAFGSSAGSCRDQDGGESSKAGATGAPAPAFLPVPETAGRALTEDEITRLIMAAEQPFADIFAIVYYTGLRKRQALDLQRDQVTHGGTVLHLVVSKGRRRLNLPLARPAREIIAERLPTAQPWIFPNPATGRPFVDVRKALARAAARGGIEPCTLHDLRRTFATRLVMANTPLAVVQQWMGHRRIQSTMGYVLASPDWESRRIEVLDLGL